MLSVRTVPKECKLFVRTFHFYYMYSQLPLYRSPRDLYNSFELTEFRYKGSYINCLEVLGENILFDISEYFVISEFDIEGVDCSKINIAGILLN